MSYQALNFGTVVNDGTGDTLPVAADKINDNFVEIYNLLGDGSSLSSGISATSSVITLVSPTITGTATMANLDISGDVDIDGTLETDALTIAGVTLAETIADTVGAMVASNTETNITVTYDDSDNTLDFVVDLSGISSISGNAGTATALETARTIHGVSFDGTANIDLTEVVQDTVGAMFSSNTETGITVTYQDADGTIDLAVGTLNQDTTGNAATATALETARTIHGVSFDGTANIDLTEVVQDTVGAMFSSNTETNITATYQDSDGTIDLVIGTLNQDTTGNAATATALETARTIGGTSFDGTANIAVALSATATALETARTIHGVSFDGTANIDLTEVVQDTVGAMFSSNTETGITATYQDADGTIDLVIGTLNQNTTGNAATATALETARTIHGVSFDGTGNIDLTEVVQDTVGAMFGSNTETGITVTYQDADGTIDLVVGTLNQDTTGTAAKVTVTDSTANTNFPVTFHDESNSLLDDTGALRYNPSTGTLLVPNLVVAGTTTQVDTVTMNAENAVIFEGATADDHETTLTIIDPTADRTQRLLNQSGFIPLLAAVTTTAITSTPEELNILDGATVVVGEINALDLGATAVGTAIASKAVILDSNKDYTGIRNFTVSGELDAATGDFSGDVDVDGTLEADAITVNGTALNEFISDTVGAMVGSNTETGIAVTYQDADNTIDFALDAAQTAITSLLATDIKIGEDDQTKIDFETADEIHFYAANAHQIKLVDGALVPVTDNDIDLGTSSLEFKDAFFDGTVTSDAFAGPLTGNVTGNVSGTAATVTGAAQTNITSLGTLTALTVDNVVINGATIGHGDDTDLMTVADGILTVAGEVSVTTLDIGGTNVTSTAAELNILDGATVVVGEINALDLGSTAVGTAIASKAVILDSNKDYTGMRNLTISGEIDAATGDYSGAVDIAGATTTAAITASGIIKTDDSTAATSTTDGSLQTDGGLSVVLDAVIGDDLILLSDAAVIHFGADSDVTLTHVADTGLLLNGTSVIQFNDASQSIGAPSNAILDINATDEIELNATLVDVNANLDVSGTYTGAGTMTTGGNIVIPNAGNIGSVGDTDSIAIASDGVVTFSQIPVMPANSIDSDQYVDGSIDTAHIADNQITLAKMAGLARGKIIVGDASGDPSALAAGSNGQVLASDGTDVSFVDISVSDLAADNLSIGDAAVLLTTSSGNITIDAAANDSDIILKGTDGGADTTFLTIDGSAAGEATFNAGIVIADSGTIGSASDKDAIAIASDEIGRAHV